MDAGADAKETLRQCQEELAIRQEKLEKQEKQEKQDKHDKNAS